jgi:hypothetical protein
MQNFAGRLIATVLVRAWRPLVLRIKTSSDDTWMNAARTA